MLQEGAANNTKDEIVKVIGENPPTKYNNIDKILSLANSVFIRDTYKEYVKETSQQMMENPQVKKEMEIKRKKLEEDKKQKERINQLIEEDKKERKQKFTYK